MATTLSLAFKKLLVPVLLAASLVTCSTARAQISYRFSFGSAGQKGWMMVSPTNLYSAAAGYGFEPGASLNQSSNAVSSTTPFYFSTKLPEGNYVVTLLLGSETASTNTVKSELRRLMLEKVPVPAGHWASRSIIVNVRSPQIPDGTRVRLKARETSSEIWDWDDKLTLEFNGDHPSLRAVDIESASVPTVFLIGDSTVCDQPAEPWSSWGQMLPRFFKPLVAVANHAESGETISGSLSARRFDKIFSQMKPGDYLFVQFGHNDQKNPATNALAHYRADLKQIIAASREKGGTPVLVTPMERKTGLDHDTLGGYPDSVREVAREEDCALIDLNQMSRVFYKVLGEKVDLAFQDGTHHNNYGSYELAKCVILGIQQDKLPLAMDIVDDFGFDPAHPEDVATFKMAVSPKVSMVKPLGN